MAKKQDKPAETQAQKEAAAAEKKMKGTVAGLEAAEKAAVIAEKKQTDAANKKAAAEQAKKQASLADTPLTQDELDFIAINEPKMGCGRSIDQPAPADILRLSQLLKRIDVKAKE